MNPKTITGFSKLSKEDKLKWLEENFCKDGCDYESSFRAFWLEDQKTQNIFDSFSENTISNYILPYGIAPNFLIDDVDYCVPMVTEESSVVAAASSAAKYWYKRGGFKTSIIDTVKVGQIHFIWSGPKELLWNTFDRIKEVMLKNSSAITENMKKRGGGILAVELLDFTDHEKGLYQIRAHFDTCDSMGANFINSVLENFSKTIETFFINDPQIPDNYRDVDVIMSILSNYTPECVVRSEVSCPVSQLGAFTDSTMTEKLAKKFSTAVRIAQIDPYRATTHNKGIFNGIDAVILATGNDFRAIEAGGHAYAARDGQYRSLSDCEVSDGMFRFWLEVPLALGTVGGLTSLHPLAKKSLEILDSPSAEQLMRITASVGLAQNFAAVRSLVTTGIQKGHMKMHLMNILNHFEATDQETRSTFSHFEDKTVSFSEVRDYIEKLRHEAKG